MKCSDSRAKVFSDLTVHIVVDIPKSLTEEQKKLLKEFDKSYVANKGKEGFFDKFKKK